MTTVTENKTPNEVATPEIGCVTTTINTVDMNATEWTSHRVHNTFNLAGSYGKLTPKAKAELKVVTDSKVEKSEIEAVEKIINDGKVYENSNEIFAARKSLTNEQRARVANYLSAKFGADWITTDL